jgi:endonuclease I
MKRIYSLLLFYFFSFPIFSQIPTGYYDSVQGLTGEDLRSALYEIIKDHNEQSYGDLHEHYKTTDKKSDGTVWDMYSDVPMGTPSYIYNFDVDKCGNYSQEGDCYNREHTTPADWYNDAAPVYTDLFNVYPADGYVNGKRDNNPYGDVANVSWTSTNGGLLGSSADTGYVGNVFEPIDEYKGDLARTYFYMATRYKDVISTWSSPMYSGDNFTAWAVRVLRKWALTDTVSQKEIDRNNAVYNIQNNRNPFIDHPEWVVEIFGDTLSDINNVDNYILPKIWYTNNSIHLSTENSTEALLMIFDVMGNEIRSFKADHSSNFNIDLDHGIYFANYSGLKSYTLKFVVIE